MNRVLQYHGRAIYQGPLLVAGGEPLHGPQGGLRAPVEKPSFKQFAFHDYSQLRLVR